LYDSTTKWPEGFDYRNSGAVGPQAVLRGVDLRGLKLAWFDLAESDLHQSDLRGCDLTGASLIGCILHEANLDNANLYHANLYRANLLGAIYSRKTIWPHNFDYSTSNAINNSILLMNVVHKIAMAAVFVLVAPFMLLMFALKKFPTLSLLLLAIFLLYSF
jgi:hypothetical protein